MIIAFTRLSDPYPCSFVPVACAKFVLQSTSYHTSYRIIVVYMCSIAMYSMSMLVYSMLMYSIAMLMYIMFMCSMLMYSIAINVQYVYVYYVNV